MAHDFWVIHPKFADARDPLFISDRDDIAQLDLAQTGDVRINPDRFRDDRVPVRKALLRIIDAWWSDLDADDLDGFIVEESSRSTPDDLEFLIYPPTMKRDQAEALISPYKADKAPKLRDS